MSRKKPMEININSNINVEQNGVYVSNVRKSGNGATIGFYKEFIGEEVLIIRVKKMKDKKNTKELTKKERKKMIKKWANYDH